MTSEFSKNNKDFYNFLSEYEVTKKGKNIEKTHITCGPPWKAYNIPEDKTDTFNKLYGKLVDQTTLCFTERNKNVGPLLLDVDFKLKNKKRVYKERDIKYLVKNIRVILKKYYELKKYHTQSFVFEKSRPTKDKDSGVYKDGFHVVYPNLPLPTEMRHLVLSELANLVKEEDGLSHIGYTNDIHDVIDTNIVMNAGWCMYGSKKHNGLLYRVTKIYNYRCDILDEEYDKEVLVKVLSVRKFNDRDALQLKSDVDDLNFHKKLSIIREKYGGDKKKKSKQKERLEKHIEMLSDESESSEDFDQKIDDDLKSIKKKVKDNQKKDYDIDRVTSLVKLFSKRRATSYDTWTNVGWALYSIDSDNLLPLFKKFSSKCKEKYDEEGCDKLWENAYESHYTIATLERWARKDNPKQYLEYIRSGTRNLLKKAESGTEFDIASVIYEMYKNQFKCTSISDGTWYEFQEHRWVEIDKGYTLDLKISNELTKEFIYLSQEHLTNWEMEKQGLYKDEYMKKATKILKLANDKLKNSASKDRIMKECAKRFYNKQFEEELDSNRDLIGFENGVFDLKTFTFREGSPDDKISLTTGYDYKEYSLDHKYIEGIYDFFKKIQPEEDMREYILTLLASYTDGYNNEQKFIIWTGCGCFAAGQKIMMMDGSLKNVEDIKVGDLLFGDDSTPRKVLRLYRGENDMYEINCNNTNTSYTVTGNHRLSLKYKDFGLPKYNNKLKRYIVNWCEFDDSKGIVLKRKKFKKMTDAVLFQNVNKSNNMVYIRENHKLRIKVVDFLKMDELIRDQFHSYKCMVEFKEKDLGYSIKEYTKDIVSKIISGESVEIDKNLKLNSLKIRQKFYKYFMREIKKHKNIYSYETVGKNGLGERAVSKHNISIQDKNINDQLSWIFTSIGMNSFYYERTLIIKEEEAKGKINIVKKSSEDFYGFHLDKNQAFLLDDLTCTLNSNGKSKTINFFEKAIGGYFGVMPITFLTRKSDKSSQATPELADKRGVRFVVFQEPEAGDKINISKMKEMSGEDYVHARPLFKKPFKFKPQFKMLLTCNDLPEIPATDHGTWRRIRVSPFESEFVDINKKGNHSRTGEPLDENQFPKDYKLDEKLEKWKQAFMWLLLNVYYKKYKKDGLKEPKKVTQKTEDYEKESDLILEYLSNNITKTGKKSDYVRFDELCESFISWYSTTYAGKKKPTQKIFKQYLLDRKYTIVKGKVFGVIFNNESDSEDEMEYDSD